MTVYFIILFKNPGIEYSEIFNADSRVKKGNMLFKATFQELKSKTFSLEKIKDDANAVRFYNGFENHDPLIVVFKCLEPKASRMYFWQGTDKCKFGTLKYQNENTKTWT